MKSFYILFLLSALILTNPTSANASPLEKKWKEECCPVAKCVFEKGKNPQNLPTSPNRIPATLRAGYNRNTFDGFLVFAETQKNKNLGIAGFIDIDGTLQEGQQVEAVYDIHVAPCDTANST